MQQVAAFRNLLSLKPLLPLMRIFLLLALLANTAILLPAQNEQQPSTKRTVTMWGHVKNAITHEGIPDALITVMRPDSSVIDTLRTFNMGNWHATKNDAGYRLQVPAHAQRFIIRAEHPDFETTYVDFEIKRIARNTYFDAPWHLMKKKTSPEEKESLAGGTLGEVVVKKTRVKMFYRGDTITFNADAFNIPDGSMLDVLIRQMDGVELKDDGRILVNGEQVDELLLNGKDFFKGNNKVMLENLPAYTINQVQTYHKTTELSEYYGHDVEKKRFVMDVKLKREYNQGYLANAEVAGGLAHNKQKHGLSSPTENESGVGLLRLFGMRYTNNSRISLFGNMNNVNENRRPGSDGEWQPSNMPSGEQENRMGGIDLLIDEKDKRWSENAHATIQWTKSNDLQLVSAEQFHTNAPSTYQRNANENTTKNLNISAQNTFRLLKPFFLHNNNGFTYTEGDQTVRDRAAQFQNDPARYGHVNALLDSVFSASLNTDIQQMLVNSTLRQEESSQNRTDIWSNTSFDYKLPSGDGTGIMLNLRHSHEHRYNTSEQQLRYQLTPSLNSILNRHGRTPSRNNYGAVTPFYRITWPSGFYLVTEYRFMFQQRENTNDLFLADTLDLQNTYDRTHRRVENRLAIIPGYQYERNGKYIRAYYQMHFYNVNEQLDYRSAYADTSLVQHCWTMSPELHVQIATHNWTRSLRLFYGIEFQTPDLFQKVNILNNENPLIRRYGNPNLRGATIHRMQINLGRNWREKRISHNTGGGLRFFRHQVSQGQTYDAATGITTYRPENVEGNWQTYFFNYFNMPLDKPKRLTMNIYTHGDYTRHVDIATTQVATAPTAAAGEPATTSPQSLTHVNNYYIQNRLTLSYTFGNLSLSLPTHVEYRHTTNEEGTIAPINATNFQYGLTANYNFKKSSESHIPRWLQGFTLATDLKMFSRRGYGSAELNTNDLVWNASISHTFAKNRLTARLEGFDLLGQLSSTTIVINGLGRTETLRNTLPRYAMLHLTYRLAKQPKNKIGK